MRYKALFKCVIREGADKESKKLGDLAEGTIIKVVDYVTLDDGTERVQVCIENDGILLLKMMNISF